MISKKLPGTSKTDKTTNSSTFVTVPKPNWNSLDSEYGSPEDSKTLKFLALAFFKDMSIRV